MNDKPRIVPPVTAYGYPGQTEITRDGRSIACLGTGPEIEAAILACFSRPSPKNEGE